MKTRVRPARRVRAAQPRGPQDGAGSCARLAGLLSETPGRVLLLVGGSLFALYLLLPPSAARNALYDAVGLLAAAATACGIRRFRPRPAWPWWLLTANLLLLCTGDIVYDVSAHTWGELGFPSVVDVLYLASYPVLAVGVIGLLRARGGRRDLTALLDALFGGLVFGVVVWVYFIEPSIQGEATLAQKLVAAAYPAMDVLLLVVLARLFFASATRSPTVRLLLGAIALELVADLIFASLALHDAYTVGDPVDVVFLASYLCMAFAAVHPSMGLVTAPGGEPDPPTRARLALVAAAALVLPVLAAAEALSAPRHALVLSLAAGPGFLMLLARSGVVHRVLRAAMKENLELLERERDVLERERDLRAIGAAQSLSLEDLWT